MRKPDDDDLPPLDPRYRWLAEGDLDEDERAALRAESERTAEGREAFAALAPLDESLFARVASQVHAPPVPVRGANRRWVPLAALPLAAAALLALANPLAAPLPAYRFEWRAGETVDAPAPGQTRSSPAEGGAEPRRFTAGAPVDLVVRPQDAIRAGLAVMVLVDGEIRPIAPFVFPDTGTVRLQGRIGEAPWDLPAGAHELTIAIGPARAVHLGSALVDPRWQTFTVALVVE